MWWPFSKKKKKETVVLAENFKQQTKVVVPQPVIQKEIERRFFAEDQEFDRLFKLPEDESLKTEEIAWPSEEEYSDIKDICAEDFPEPNHGFEIFQAVHNPDATVKEIADAVAKDPALVALILKEVNSAKYAFNHEVNDVARAIVLLGYNEVKSIVLQNSISSIFAQDEEDRLRILHARTVSLIAFQLASHYQVNANELSTFGMLHNIGAELEPHLKFVLDSYELSQQTLEGILGVIFFHSWELPIQFGPWLKELTVLKEETSVEVAILGVANYLANCAQVEDCYKEYKIPEKWFSILKLEGKPSTWFNEKARLEIKRALNLSSK